MIKDNQRRMINSLLERPYKKVVIDRLVVNKNRDKELISDPKEVLESTAKHFRKQFKKRNFRGEEISEEWKKTYEPIPRIQEKLYKNLNSKITKDEWESMLSKLKANTAPGISGISYTLIKQAGADSQEAFRNFASRCIESGEIPLKWKIGQTYPIPKDTEWGYDLSNIRPIALLETFRKCVTKVFTTKLEKIIRENNLLERPNYAGLRGGSTENPIHVLSMIIEEAKERTKNFG